MLKIRISTKNRVHIGSGVLIFLAALIVAGCDRIEQDAGNVCYANVDGEKIFLGTVACLGKLPEKKLCGYWMIGFEYSVLFEDLQSLENRELSKGFWLNLSPRLPRSNTYFSDNVPSVYNVCFNGTRSTTMGYYADGFDELAGGVLVKEFTRLELLTQDAER